LSLWRVVATKPDGNDCRTLIPYDRAVTAKVDRYAGEAMALRAIVERDRCKQGGCRLGTYVDSSLLPNETVMAEAKPHWAMFIAPGLVFLLGFLLGKAGGLFFFVGIVWGIFRFLVWRTTELAVTNKRVIAKSGIIRRNVIDVSIAKVEGVSYSQGIIGRIFGYGSILVRGTGLGQVPVRFISQPELFKQEVGRTLHD
jgi:membrane protein YdbS with pleckstrin-like domain